MQVQDPRKYQGSKSFVEGRLKLSTACTECHKRKQKCNQQQPCQHCSRRYPPPQCIYRRKINGGAAPAVTNGLTAVPPGSNGLSGACFTHRGEISRVNGHSLSFIDDPKALSSEKDIKQEDSIGNGPDRQDSNFMDAFDDFDTDSYRTYQTSLDTIISRMSEAVVSGELETNQQPCKSQEQPNGSLTLSISNTVSVEPLHFLGIAPTAENAALLSAFVKLLTKYTVSLDGQPTPNYYNIHFVPWSLKSPLLATLSIYTTAAIQSESRKIPPNNNPLVLSHKITAIHLLNEKLHSKKGLEEQVGNEAICAVAILVSMEWYWSEFDVIEKHLKGLVEMVRLRGGLGELGLHEFLKRMILIVDYNIATTYDLEPYFVHNTAILPPHPAHVMTPLLSSGGVTFASKNEELGISNETATILDNIRFLILATTRTVNRPTTTKEREKLKSTARWTRDGIAALPTRNELDSPLTQDFVYQSVIITAQIYCRAITEHIPLSKACRIQDLAQLWGSVWRVSLRRWKQIPGIFLWILLSAIQVAEKTPHGRFLKTMVKGVMTYLAVEFWDVVDGAGMGFVRLQRWLRGADIWDCREMEATEQHKEEAMDFLHVYEE